MLGEMIGELRGKMLGQRVLAPDAMGPKMEMSFQQAGSVLGTEVTNALTLVATAGPGGAMHVEGNGILMTREGEAAMAMITGLNKMMGPGMAGTSVAAVFFRTQSTKLARLNKMMAVVNVEQDADGNTHVKMWEWE